MQLLDIISGGAQEASMPHQQGFKVAPSRQGNPLQSILWSEIACLHEGPLTATA